MVLDDILLNGRDIKIPDRILTCDGRMGKSVKSASSFARLMPVVKKIVMQQCSSYQSLTVDLDAKDVLEIDREYETELGNSKRMLKHRSGSVLRKLLHLLRLIGDYKISSYTEYLLGDLVLSNLFPHELILLRI